MKKAKEQVMPRIMKDKVIQRLTDDDMLYEIATIIRKFLRSTWLIEPTVFYFNKLIEQNLIAPMSQLLALKMKLKLMPSEQKLRDICWHITKPFLNKEFAEILIGKIILVMDHTFAYRELGLGMLINEKIQHNHCARFLIETTGETWHALEKLKLLPVDNFKQTLTNLIDKRREHINEYYHFIWTM